MVVNFEVDKEYIDLLSLELGKYKVLKKDMDTITIRWHDDGVWGQYRISDMQYDVEVTELINLLYG